MPLFNKKDKEMVKIINIDTKTRTIRVSNADGDIKAWRTTESGAHFPIKKGESTKEALDKFVEKKRPEAKKKSGLLGDRPTPDEQLKTPKAREVYDRLTRYASEHNKDLQEDDMKHLRSLRDILLDDNNAAEHVEKNFQKWFGSSKQQPNKETSDTKGTMKESATDWYAKKFKGDKKMAPKDGVTFEQLYESLKKGENIYEKMGVDDSIVRERVMSEMADRLGVKYDHVYDLWLNGGEKDSEPRKKKQEEAIALMDKLLKEHTDLDPELRKAIVSARQRAKKDIK